MEKDMKQPLTGTGTALPKYRCHKEVYALKISAVFFRGDGKVGRLELEFEDKRFLAREVPAEYLEKHNPQAGGYWVRYEDGYESFSPAKAFESGYTRIED